jgi:hypothetical protein
LDRRGDGEGHWDQRQFGATDLAYSWPAAPSGPPVNDPQFAAKLREIVGLYVNPPNHAIVLSVDEKSQIQALDRTQPGLSMKKGRAGTITHDYKRHGVTTLFAALDVLEGEAPSPSGVHPLPQRHRCQGGQDETGACDRRQLCRSQAPQGS